MDVTLILHVHALVPQVAVVVPLLLGFALEILSQGVACGTLNSPP